MKTTKEINARLEAICIEIGNLRAEESRLEKQRNRLSTQALAASRAASRSQLGKMVVPVETIKVGQLVFRDHQWKIVKSRLAFDGKVRFDWGGGGYSSYRRGQRITIKA